MKLAFTTLGCPDWDIETVIARAKEYGFDGVDFRGCAGEMDLWKLPDFSSRLAETAAKLKGAGLNVPCMSSSGRLLVDTAAERDASLANVAAFAEIGTALGATFVRVFGGRNGDRSYGEALREAASMLDEMARAAAKSGVSVLLETHDDWIATDKVAALLDAAAEPNVGAIWDINHPFRTAGESPEQSWANFGRWVRYTHIKDTRALAEKNQPCLLGAGEVPVAEVLALLRRVGYDGWCAFEWEKKWHAEIEPPELAFPHYAAFMRAALAGA